VPFARFAAQYINELGTPFKRYHMGPVWRGENPAHGRFREFWQCDFDTIGTTSNAADIETALVINELLQSFGFAGFCIHVNNRMVLNGCLEEMGLTGQTAPLLRAQDKLAKAGRDVVAAEMIDKAGVTAAQAERILALVETTGTNSAILDRLQSEFGNNLKAAEGIKRLRELISVAAAAGIPEERLRIDLSIARGLDYYTGTIFETFLTDMPAIGSICSGGRYDDLASLYTKQRLPGVGASLGLDRLLAAMEELKLLPKVSTPAPVLLIQFTPERLGEYQSMAGRLRRQGIGVEVFPEPKKIGQQLQYAEKRGFRYALIAGPDEFDKGVWKIKDLTARTEQTIPSHEVANALFALMAGAKK
jgi:histidyl-tRNA synthetase